MKIGNPVANTFGRDINSIIMDSECWITEEEDNKIDWDKIL